MRVDRGAAAAAARLRLRAADRRLGSVDYEGAAEWIDCYVRRRRRLDRLPMLMPVGNLHDLVAWCPRLGHAAILVLALALASCGSVAVAPSGMTDGGRLEVAAAVDAAADVVGPSVETHTDAGAEDAPSDGPVFLDAGAEYYTAADVDAGADADATQVEIDAGAPDVWRCPVGKLCPIGGAP